MAQEKKLVIGAINITMQPHSPQSYLNLFRDAFKLRRAIQVLGDQYALLARAEKASRSQSEPGPITGDIFRFTSIDKESPWFNMATNDFASEGDIESVNLPENMKPNSARFTYIFYPASHLFFYEGYYAGLTFGPTSVERFVKRLLNADKLVKHYGKIEVTHVPEINKLQDALALPKKERIELLIRRPNPDDLAEAEQKVLKRLNALNVEESTQTFKAANGESIAMDDELTTLATIAANNGEVKVKGKNAQARPVEYSTSNHPHTETHYYNPLITTTFNFFQEKAEHLRDRIIKTFKK